MTRRLFEFKCDESHVTEKYIDDNVFDIHCPACGNSAGRQINAALVPRGVMGVHWALDRAKKQAKEKA